MRKDSHPFRTKDLAVPSDASRKECGIDIGKCRSNKNTASNACGVFAFAAHSDVDAAFLADGVYLLHAIAR